MKKIIPAILLLVLSSFFTLSAQISTRQAGIRLGGRSGIFYQVTSETGNAETGYNLMAGLRQGGLQLTGLKITYEDNLSNISPNLYLGWGYGGHAGFIYTNHLRSWGEEYYFQNHRFCPLIGIDGWLAAEYRIRDIPLIVSLNFKPNLELTFPAFIRLMPVDFAFSFSYVF
jgi:hypothetical protein